MSLLTILLYIICLILILIFLFLIIGLQFHIFLEFHDDFFGKIEVNIFKKINRKISEEGRKDRKRKEKEAKR